jgi:hypothetical protein
MNVANDLFPIAVDCIWEGLRPDEETLFLFQPLGILTNQ